MKCFIILIYLYPYAQNISLFPDEETKEQTTSKPDSSPHDGLIQTSKHWCWAQPKDPHPPFTQMLINQGLSCPRAALQN